MAHRYSIPDVYSRPRRRAEGFTRLRTDICGFVGIAGPRHVGEAVALDDWKSYVAMFRQDEFGQPVAAPTGGALESAIRDFFSNGGARVWVVNIAERIDPERREEQLRLMLGLGPSLEPHGLELLLREPEVSVVALPDLDARLPDEGGGDEEILLPPGKTCFGPCAQHSSQSAGTLTLGAGSITTEPVFDDDQRMWVQRSLIARLQQAPWRWFGILTPPPGLNAAQAVEWRQRLTQATGGDSVAALYWPWLQMQDSPGAPVVTRSPVGAVAGVFADVDLSIGPHVAPAARRITGAVAPENPVNDEDNRRAYDAGVCVIRDFPSRGVQVWGARTLLWTSADRSRGDSLSYVNARRCLNAIARTCETIGQALVFDPNTVILRIRMHQILTDYLLRVYNTGALKGSAPEQAFFVEVEPIQPSAEGQLVCNIGVALSAPAEFIEFRIGRELGTIETGEAA